MNAADHSPGLFLMADSLARGGTERQFVTVAKALQAGSFDVRLGCLARRGEFVDSLPDVKEFAPGNSLFKPRSHLTRMALARYLHRNQVVVAHAFEFYSNMMLVPAAWLARVPVILGSHRQIGDLLTPRQFGAQKMMFRLCDRVVCNSRAAADHLQRSGVPQDRLVVIPNALPDAAFAENAPALPRAPGGLRVGMIARMNDAVKNHCRFLRVAALLVPRFPQAEFVLVGDGPLRPELEGYAAELGVSERVKFLGDRSDIAALLASMDLTVLPSLSESLSNVILESMAAGVPVVAARVGGNPELISDGENGFLVEQDDTAFAFAIGKLLADPALRKQYGAKAQSATKARYSVDTIRDRYEQLYLTLLAAKDRNWAPGKVTHPA